MFAVESSQIMNRLQNALNKPIQTRCAELRVLIDRGTMPELQTIFPILIDNIFGPQGTFSWGLRTTTASMNSIDFQALQNFLHPLGPMFKLIYTLLNDPLIKYEFPIIYVPLKVRHMLENSNKHPFYSEVVNINPQTKQIVSLMLNPFDFYIFHFAFHLINPWHQRSSLTCGINWSTVYYMLCCDYALHFLPTDPNTPVLPLLHFYTGKNPTQILPIFNRPTRMSKLIRPNAINEPIDFHMQEPCEYHPRSQIWRSETVLTAFIDLWLHNDNVNGINSNFNTNTTTFKELPTGEYIRIIRVLVKQLHAFASSGKFDDTHLGELKRIAVPMIQGKLYIFLRNLVHQWPLDGSFRLVLELWLSFIQPWRYPGTQHLTKHLNQPEVNPDVEDIAIGPMKSVDQEFLPFIAENLLAYVVIFQQLLPRFSRIDLSSPKMSLMLYRLTKVFDQPNLVNLLKEVESCVQNNNSSPTHSYNATWGNALPPLSPTSNWCTNMSFNSSVSSPANDSSRSKSGRWSSLVRKRIFELEGPNFCYKPLFNAPVAQEVYDLMVQVKKALASAESTVMTRLKEIENQSFLSYFASLFTYEGSTDEFSLEERKKVPVYLNYALQHLKDMFQIDEFSIKDTSSSFNSSSTSDSSAGVSITNDFSCLTPQKVRERISKIKFQGNPDALPVQSNESEFLVNILRQLCTKINTEFQDKMLDYYNRPDYLGKLTRQLLCPPITYHRFDKSQGRSIRVSESLPPRVSLRFLAKYKVLAYFLFGAGISWFNNYSLTGFLLFILILWFLYKCLKALVSGSNSYRM